MSSIFCLETEWEQSIHDMKKESYVRPLLQYLQATEGTEFVLFTHQKSLGCIKLGSKVEKQMKFYGDRLKFMIF